MSALVNKLSAKYRIVFLVGIDTFATVFTLFSALCLKFPVQEAMDLVVQNYWLPLLFISSRIFTFQSTGLYVLLWRHASIKALFSIVKAVTLSSFYVIVILFLTKGSSLLPNSVLIIDWTLNLLVIGGIRIALRAYRDYLAKSVVSKTLEKDKTPIIIVGAGDAGEMIAREIIKASFKYKVIGFVDDNQALTGGSIHHIPVLGTSKDLPRLVRHYHVKDIIIAIPSASSKQIRCIIRTCKDIAVRFKTTPGLVEIIDDKVSVNQLREVRISDLLGRDIVKSDVSVISAYIKQARILVTGAGGSIGSELCRQLLGFHPSELVMVDHSEHNMYMIDQELQPLRGKTKIIPIVSDIKNKNRLSVIFDTYKPEIVFHAAAYKHVPLMEQNIHDVILNNIQGTKNVLELSNEFNASKCVLISTDKAVNAVNCMGASKRLSEVLMQITARSSQTKYAAVRFGNVLGSVGSVIPHFQKQIAEGGPVTVTHPDMTRYFMTISEAVRLVVQAGGLCEGGEIFVLDMGEPVKIMTLAKDLIRLSGLEVGKDIDIQTIGIRPGEKLEETLFFSKEDLRPTTHQKISIAMPYRYDQAIVLKEITEILAQCQNGISPELLKQTLMDIVAKTQPVNQELVYH